MLELHDAIIADNHTMTESLEKYINRKRLFVRVQGVCSRELFISKLQSAFPGGRIGVGPNDARGQQPTQRVADITYENTALAQQGLRRNRFKLKVGNHDADITYQIERKDVVEKLAGEWGCRFMVVVKNLPPGEISCAELSDMFEAAGEIFTIKILSGNRGEPYALVQFMEEQSVDLCIQQFNQQKLHGAVLYVERHLKARRPGNGNGTAPPPPPPVSPPNNGIPIPGSANSSAAPTPRAPNAAAAVAGDTSLQHSISSGGTPPQWASQYAQPHQQPNAASRGSSLPSGSTGAWGNAASRTQMLSSQQSSQSQQQGSQSQIQFPASSQAQPISNGSANGLSPTASTGATPPSPRSFPKSLTINSNDNTSLFSNQHPLSKAGQDGSNATAMQHYSNNSLGSLGQELGLPSATSAGLASSPTALGNAGSVFSNNPLLTIGSAGAGNGLLSSTSLGFGNLGLSMGTSPSTSLNHNQVLTPILDLFSHLRESNTQPNQSAATATSTLSPFGMAGLGQDTVNGNGLTSNGNMTSQYQSGLMHGANGSGLMSPTGTSPQNVNGLGIANLMQNANAVRGGSMGAAGNSIAAAAAAIQHHSTAAIPKVSIRDSLRLALGRLEEIVTCPITGEIMADPVIAADGYSYERTAIQNWMGTQTASPMNGEPLAHKMLIPNKLAKDIIQDILPS